MILLWRIDVLLFDFINVFKSIRIHSIVSWCGKILNWDFLPLIVIEWLFCVIFRQLFQRLFYRVSLFQDPFWSLLLTHFSQFGKFFFLFRTKTRLNFLLWWSLNWSSFIQRKINRKVYFTCVICFIRFLRL